MTYDYEPKVITPERRAEIVVIAEGLKDDAAHDIENKREIYEAMRDLLDVASPGICFEQEVLSW